MRLQASGDFTLYPERKTSPADWVKEMARETLHNIDAKKNDPEYYADMCRDRDIDLAALKLGLSLPSNSHKYENNGCSEVLEGISGEISEELQEELGRQRLERERAARAEDEARNDRAQIKNKPKVLRLLLNSETGEMLGKFSVEPKRGSKGLTSKGAVKLRSACQILEEKANGRPIALLTLTLPSMSKQMLNFAAENWGEIMRQFTQELKRELQRVGLPDDWAYCTEWQEERGALHAHIVFIASQRKKITSADQYPLGKQWFKTVWKRVLKNVLGGDFDCKAATRIEKVKTSVGAYMSKYMSKGDKKKNESKESKTVVRQLSDWEIEQLSKHDIDIPVETIDTMADDVTIEDVKPHPSAWWGSCMDLKKEVKKRVEVWEIKISNAVTLKCSVHDQWLEAAEKIVTKLDCYWIKIVQSQDGIPRGVAGRLRQKNNWKEKAYNAIFGKFLAPPFSLKNPYWQWRYQRDKCSFHQDRFAELDWMKKQNSGSVEKKKVELSGYDKFLAKVNFRHPVAKGFNVVPSIDPVRLGVT